MFKNSSLFIVILSALVFSSCGGGGGGGGNSIPETIQCCVSNPATNEYTSGPIEAIVTNSALTSEQKSTELTTLAQDMLETPETVVAAPLVYERALRYNSENDEARFFKSILLPLLKLRGFIYKIQNLSRFSYGNVAANPDQRVDLYQQARDEIQATVFVKNNSARNDRIKKVLHFILLEPPKDNKDNTDRPFRSISELQDFLEALPPELDKASDELSKITRDFFVQMNYERFTENSQSTERTQIAHEEVQAFRYLLEGLSFLIRLLTAYNVDDWIAIKNYLEAQGGGESLNIINNIQHIKRTYPNFGKLRPNGQTAFSSILTRLKLRLVIPGLRQWALATQQAQAQMTSDRLLASTTQNAQQVADTVGDADPVLLMLSQMLDNPDYRYVHNDTSRPDLHINLVGFLQNPPLDLKALIPDYETDFEYREGLLLHINRVPDDTFGGLLPNRGFREWLQRDLLDLE